MGDFSLMQWLNARRKDHLSSSYLCHTLKLCFWVKQHWSFLLRNYVRALWSIFSWLTWRQKFWKVPNRRSEWIIIGHDIAVYASNKNEIIMKSWNSYTSEVMLSDCSESLNSYLRGNFSYVFVVCWFYQNQLFFSKNYFRNTIRVSNSLDPDQARTFVGPDLDPNCFQKLSSKKS